MGWIKNTALLKRQIPELYPAEILSQWVGSGSETLKDPPGDSDDQPDLETFDLVQPPTQGCSLSLPRG